MVINKFICVCCLSIPYIVYAGNAYDRLPMVSGGSWGAWRYVWWLFIAICIIAYVTNDKNGKDN